MEAYDRTTSTPKASLSRPITNFHHGAAIRRALLLGMTMFLAMCLGASLPLSVPRRRHGVPGGVTFTRWQRMPGGYTVRCIFCKREAPKATDDGCPGACRTAEDKQRKKERDAVKANTPKTGDIQWQ